MPLTTYTGTSEMTEVVETELIGDFIRGYDYEPRVADAIAWVRPGKGNIPVRYPRWNVFAPPAGTVAETVDAPDTNIDLAESSITPGVVRFRMPISDEVKAEAMAGIPAGALSEALEGLLDRMDSDLLSSSTSATNTVGATTSAYDLDQFRATRVDVRARRWKAPMGVALVLHDDALEALETSIQQSGGPFAIKTNERLAEGLGAGFQGTMGGFRIFCSGNVADEGAGHSNFATPIGMGRSGLGLVLNQVANVKFTRGDTAENRWVDLYHFAAWYGYGLTSPGHLVEVLSS